jgi:hypothetical protein
MTSLAEYNNNPGNIRPAKGVKYEGMIGVDDKGFAIFEKPEFGQKALVNDLTYKLEKRGIKTPSEFVDIYSPAGDENSEDSRDNYKIYIAQMLGLKSTKDPFPENAVERLSQAVTNFEGGTWQGTEEKKSTQSAPKTTQSDEDSSNQYSGELVRNELTQEEKNRSALETGAKGAAVGAALGSLYTAKAPFVRLAQRVGILPGGKPISPDDAVELASKVMGSESQTPGGKWGGKTGFGIGEGSVQETSSRYQRAMPQGKVSGRMAKRFGIPMPGENPELAQRLIDRSNAAEAAKINAAATQEAIEKATQPSAVQRVAKNVMTSAPVKGSLAGLGIGFNAQDAYHKFDQGDMLGGSLATGAAGASALGLVPRLASTMNPAAIGLTTASQIAGDLRQGNRQGAAESGLTGLTALFPRLFGPVSGLVYSGGLSQGEEEELARYRKMQPPHLRR